MNDQIITYTHKKYGTLTLKRVTSYMNVGQFHSSKVPADCFFSAEEAEKIALITENRRVQLCPVMDKIGTSMPFYLVVHSSASEACLVQPIEINYEGDNPKKEIEAAVSWCAYF